MQLANGELLNIGRKPGAVIRVEEGALWLTQERDITDYVLQAGETKRLEGRGAAILFALEDARFQVIEPQMAVRIWPALLASLSRKLQLEG
jgi:hypothetical protein